MRAAPSDLLTETQPGLRVQRDDDALAGSSLFGWWVPNSVGMVALVLFLVSLGMLFAGPQPWRATRWAWFWLLTPPVGSIAFLLLSGPTPGIPTPRNVSRRLTGGWAFLLAFPLMALLQPYPW